MKNLIIFIGHPAGGKTSASYALAKKLGKSRVIEVDKIKEKISGSVYARNEAERELWFKEINKQIKNNLEKFENVIIDEGFFTKELLAKILKGVNNINKCIIEINFELKEHLKRDKERKGDSPEAVKHMYELWNKVPEEEKIRPDIVISSKDMSTDEIVDKIIDYLE